MTRSPAKRLRQVAATWKLRSSGGDVDRSESGDTLVEILLALVILGLTSVALLLAFSTSISASATQRHLAAANIALNDYAQNVIAGIESNQDLFTCPQTARTPMSANVSYYLNELAIPATPSTATSTGTQITYTTTITSIQYWNESTSAFSTTCASNAAQEITVSVSPGSSLDNTESFVVDSPSSGSSFVGGSPTGLTFLTPAAAPPAPITASSGASLPVNPVVEVLFGNAPDATDLSPINLTLASSTFPYGPTTAGTLSGCSSNDINGVVTYTGCSITLTGAAASFTLEATDGTTVAPAYSGVINVTGSTAAYLAFTTQPQGGNSGNTMGTQPVVKAYNAGTTTVDTNVTSITLTTSGSSAGAPQLSSCSGTNLSISEDTSGIVTATITSGHTGGTFIFTSCDFAGGFYVDANSGNVATPYTMTASAPNVISATSAPFAVTGYGAAAQMEFVTEPTGGVATSTTANSGIMNSFQVAIEDSWGNILSGAGSQSGYGGSISTKIGSSTLTCTPSSSQGIFTFSGCVATLGSNLTVTASATGSGSTGVATETSSAFNVTGPVASLVWYPNYPAAGDSAQPVAGASGNVMTNQPVLAYEDAGTNPGETAPEVVTADTNPVTFTSSYSSGPESTSMPNGSLTTCSHLPPVNGVVSAGNCAFVGLVGTNYTMQATTISGPSLTSPVSSPFSPTGPGPASQLAFSPSPAVEPVAGAAGSAFTTEPVIVVEDAGGNIVSNASNQVEMNSYLYNSSTPTPTVQSGTLSNCSTLSPDSSGDVSLIPVSGYLDVEATCGFGGVINTQYQLVASAPGLTSGVSSTFTPTTFGPASQVTVTGCSPSVTWHGTCVLTSIVQDAWGNTVTSYNSGVTWTDDGGAGAVTGAGSSTAVSGGSSITVTGSVVGADDVSATADGFTSSPDAFAVTQDTTTTTVTESPTSVIYGHESASVFTVHVVTGNGEALPSSDSATVSVGGTSCTATITPGGSGGTGTCSLANSALAASATPYSVNVTYSGDIDLLGSSGTAATGLTVTKDTSSITVSETPTGVTYGHESTSVFTVNVVTGHGEVLPSSDSATVTVGGTTCTATITPSGSGGSGTCSIGNTALAFSATPYAVTASYSGDTDLSAATNASAATGVTVAKDSTTATVSESPSTVAYGHEATSIFTVNVVTGNHEVLPTTDNVTVNVGSTSCVASVAPLGTGGTGTCSIANSALVFSATAYTVTATYPGDADLTGASIATASPGLTVSKDTATTTVSESPTSVTYGSEGASIFTVVVTTGDHEVLPSTDSSTVTVGSTTCTATITPSGNGGSGTCSIAASALNASTTAYTVTAAYAGDANVGAAPTSTASTGLTVNKAAPPAISWTAPAAITYPTALSATQLDATDSVTGGGTFVYTPASGTVLSGGAQTLSVVFTPTSTNYTTASDSVPLTVNKEASTTTVSESPTTEPYGHEASSTFTVTVVTAGHQVLPSTDSAIVSVGGTTCTATITPSGTGGSGTCTIASTAVVYGASAYTVTAAYSGDTDIAASSGTAATGLTVTKDSATATVVVSPTSSAFGSESNSEFTVTVVTGNNEVLPTTDNVTVHVGTASCVAAVAPSGTGGIGFCTIANTALASSTTAYSVTATYGGDADVNAASLATASPGFTVTKFTPTVTVTNTTNPTALGAGTLTLTATVAGTGTVGPTGTLTWTVSSSGKAFNTCTSALTAGSGSSTATCTVSGPTAGIYTSSVSYAGDTNYAAASSALPFDLVIGGSSASDLSTTSLYYLIDGNTAGFSSVGSADYQITSPVVLTGITGIITPGFTSGTTPTATFAVGQGNSTFSSIFSCNVTTASPGTTCTTPGSQSINASSGTPAYIDIRAQELAGSDSFAAMWIVTFTT
jgi:hypothetical protein